jgi:hypothetical protein
MDTNRSPGVGPLTWVTPGLLAFSWLFLSGLMTWYGFGFPWGLKALLVGVVIWLVISGPHLLFGAAAWRSGKNPDALGPALMFALLYAGSAVAIGVGELTGVGQGNGGLICCGHWLLGWPVGIVALRATFRADPPQVPPDGD